ncbi:MAG: cupin domain-containing protein [Anaerolineae bacterium]|nr:cupin domain-containing protein [Anaerolineae bacterium]MDW8101329.1 cupin domain-containing protein [Anaerolineae bacterium]
MEPLVLKAESIPWQPHSRFQGVWTKIMVSSRANPAMSLHLVKIEPGSAIAPHIHPDSTETFTVISGRGLCVVGGQEFNFGPGDCAVAPAGVEHGLRNTGDDPIILLAIFTPPLV